MNKEWIFKCPKCGFKNKVNTCITKRTIDDKPTEKRLNTAVSCSNCKEVTIIENLEELFQIEFDWKSDKVAETEISEP